MIISTNPIPTISEFELLVTNTLDELSILSSTQSNKLSQLSGRDFEPIVRDVMTNVANGTPFENSIELIGGQKFPDIVARKFYGIEVKTTKQNHWKTTGNSVLETTRVDNVERIYMLFAKLANPIEFRCRPYEDVLSEVVVTHSPRYLIDMNLEKGSTFFDKINITYDTLRKEDNPIKPIVNYYKSKLKEGEQMWWIDNVDTPKASNIIIRIWSSLSITERNDIRNKAMILFPELFGKRNDKFTRLALWLITSEAIVCPNIRDVFTAGGKGSIIIDDIHLINMPRIIINLFNNMTHIIETVTQTSNEELGEYWGIETNDTRKLRVWADLISENAKDILGVKANIFKESLLALINKHKL